MGFNLMRPVVREIASIDAIGTAITLQYPRDLSQEELADMQEWLALIVAKLKRLTTPATAKE